jgi:hypothetical protein
MTLLPFGSCCECSSNGVLGIPTGVDSVHCPACAAAVARQHPLDVSSKYEMRVECYRFRSLACLHATRNSRNRHCVMQGRAARGKARRRKRATRALANLATRTAHLLAKRSRALGKQLLCVALRGGVAHSRVVEGDGSVGDKLITAGRAGTVAVAMGLSTGSSRNTQRLGKDLGGRVGIFDCPTTRGLRANLAFAVAYRGATALERGSNGVTATRVVAALGMVPCIGKYDRLPDLLGGPLPAPLPSGAPRPAPRPAPQPHTHATRLGGALPADDPDDTVSCADILARRLGTCALPAPPDIDLRTLLLVVGLRGGVAHRCANRGGPTPTKETAMNLVEALVGSKPSRPSRREPGETDTQRLGGALRRRSGGRWGSCRGGAVPGHLDGAGAGDTQLTLLTCSQSLRCSYRRRQRQRIVEEARERCR